MVCVYCGSPTAVKNSRLQRNNNYVWRRRICLKCGSAFTTTERSELSSIFMVGRPGSRKQSLEPFSRDRLFLSVYESCKHRANAVSEAASLTQTIINKLVLGRQGGIIGPTAITEQTYLVLKHFDQTAATVYAAYHKNVVPAP